MTAESDGITCRFVRVKLAEVTFSEELKTTLVTKNVPRSTVSLKKKVTVAVSRLTSKAITLGGFVSGMTLRARLNRRVSPFIKATILLPAISNRKNSENNIQQLEDPVHNCSIRFTWLRSSLLTFNVTYVENIGPRTVPDVSLYVWPVSSKVDWS